MDKNTNHFVSLIIPAYKKEKIIVENVTKIKSVLDLIRYDYEIIVVIDGEVDRSFELLKTQKLDRVKIVYYRQNQGKSFAIRLGMSYAKGDYIMFLDSGFEIDPNGISMLLEHMEWYDADVVVGSKRHPASQVQYAKSRKFLSIGYYYFVKFLFGIKVKDTQAGIKIFKKNVIEKVLPRLVEKKFAGDLEMLVVADSLGFSRIYEAPIKLDYNFALDTTAATVDSIWNIFIDTIAIFYRNNILQYYRVSRNKFVVPKELEIKVIKG
jgi:glycosyltransferase involved in cell wall biosynthesis